MSGPVFVRDAEGRPLMPMAPTYARKLLANGKASLVPHYAFTVIQLHQVIEAPVLRVVAVGVMVQRRTAQMIMAAEGEREVFPLLSIMVDLHTDLPRRVRRRAAIFGRRRIGLRAGVRLRTGIVFRGAAVIVRGSRRGTRRAAGTTGHERDDAAQSNGNDGVQGALVKLCIRA